MWRMRESEWERERQARDRLMAEVSSSDTVHNRTWIMDMYLLRQVLTERQKQIDMKMEVVKEQQVCPPLGPHPPYILLTFESLF